MNERPFPGRWRRFAQFLRTQSFKSVIPRNVRLAEAPSFGKPIIFYDIHSKGGEGSRSTPRRLLPCRERAGRGLGALFGSLSSKPLQIRNNTSHVTTASAPQPLWLGGAHPGPQQIDIDLSGPVLTSRGTRFREKPEELARSIQASG